MPISRAGYNGPSEIKYLFIDGAYLREALADFGRQWLSGVVPELDYAALSNGFTKTFYYDCMPSRKTDESTEDYEARRKPQEQLFDRLCEATWMGKMLSTRWHT